MGTPPATCKLTPSNCRAHRDPAADALPVRRPDEEEPVSTRNRTMPSEQAGGAIGISALHAVFHGVYVHRLQDLTRSGSSKRSRRSRGLSCATPRKRRYRPGRSPIISSSHASQRLRGQGGQRPRRAPGPRTMESVLPTAYSRFTGQYQGTAFYALLPGRKSQQPQTRNRQPRKGRRKCPTTSARRVGTRAPAPAPAGRNRKGPRTANAGGVGRWPERWRRV